MLSWAYGLAMLAAIVLLLGGAKLWARDRKRALLMIGAAAVTILNVILWSGMPDAARPDTNQPDSAGVTAAAGG
ncbi:hypothetical protein ACUJ46_04205 [Sandaracinobacteroides sp. A072]|uniref:hypothetical protein n=1 Tax=Sandaracinobacteroides sp. A072 TaxID=3461146 RepID=UPI0040437842